MCDPFLLIDLTYSYVSSFVMLRLFPANVFAFLLQVLRCDPLQFALTYSYVSYFVMLLLFPGFCIGIKGLTYVIYPIPWLS